jgi:hypothetical protein
VGVVIYGLKKLINLVEGCAVGSKLFRYLNRYGLDLPENIVQAKPENRNSYHGHSYHGVNVQHSNGKAEHFEPHFMLRSHKFESCE